MLHLVNFSNLEEDHNLWTRNLHLGRQRAVPPPDPSVHYADDERDAGNVRVDKHKLEPNRVDRHAAQDRHGLHSFVFRV